MLFYTHTGSFEENNLEIHCEDIFPMDLGSGTFTSFTTDETVVAYIAENIDLFSCDMGLVHSHHSLGAFISGTDRDTIQSKGNDTNCFVSLIVDTRGTYVAAITRKIQTKKKIITEDLGTSYEFFGEGSVKMQDGKGLVEGKNTEESFIEYFMLDVQIEQVDNPLSYLDTRFEEIQANKQKFSKVHGSSPINNSPVILPKSIHGVNLGEKSGGISISEDTEFNDWLHKRQNTYEQTLFSEEEMNSMIDTSEWQPDPTIIHYLAAQLVTCSLIVNKDIDLKQWIVKHMEKKYDELFVSTSNVEFETWADNYIEFISNHYNDPAVPTEVYDDWDTYMSRINEALAEELGEYPGNPYLDYYIDLLLNKVYE